MGQASCKSCSSIRETPSGTIQPVQELPDLATLPPEVAVQVLSQLDATDLCLAGCVNEFWCSLANVDVLWKGLCYQRWGYASAYRNRYMDNHSFKDLYMTLDNGMLTFAANPNEGIKYLIREDVLEDNTHEITQFIYLTNSLSWPSLELYLQERTDILMLLVSRLNLSNHSIPNALRYFFSCIPAPKQRGHFLQLLLESFSKQYLLSNNPLPYTKDDIYVICYSLILLSVDLTSPHVKNKMSKREFIRNLRRAMPAASLDDIDLGHMYDNIYMHGHVH